MKTQLVIFDLDGTLLNTIGDLAVACNAVLALRGLPEHTYAEYCHFVGNGIMRLVERALPEELRTAENVAAVRADFVKYYTGHIDIHTKLYEGIPELIAEVPFRNTFTKWTYIGRINKFHSAVPTFIHNTHHYFLLLPEYHLPPDNGKMLSAVLYPSSQMRSWMSAFHYRNKGTSSDSVLWNVTK